MLLGNRCPECRKGAVFRGFFSMNRACSECGRVFEKEPGYFLGASVAAYFIGAFSLVPTLVICLLILKLDIVPTLAIGTTQMLILTPFLWRFSRLVWLYAERRMTQRLGSTDETAGTPEKSSTRHRQSAPR